MDKAKYERNSSEARKRFSSTIKGIPTYKRSRQSTINESSLNPTKKPDNPLTSPYGRCPNVSERYKKISRIGEGTYGIVYKAIDQEASTNDSQKIVALKRCLPHFEASDGFPITTLREIQILREISLDGGHENIVALKEVAVGSNCSSVFLVFEYLHFDLAKLIDEHYGKYSKSPFTLAQTKCLAKQLLSALVHLHEKCIIHRDLKLSNLLYDKDRGLLKLADFGLARKMEGVCEDEIATLPSYLPSARLDMDLTPRVVSLWYRPPELLLNATTYSMAIDQWATGCVIAELILGKPLFRGKNDLDQIGKIVEVLGSPTVKDWPDLLDMPLVKGGTVQLPFAVAHNEVNSNQTKGTLMDIFTDFLSPSGFEVFENLLMYNPKRRWSATVTHDCAWFDEYPHAVNREFMPRFDNKL